MALTSVAPARRRVPVVVLTLLSLVLGGTLLVTALTATPAASRLDPAAAAALASALASGQDAVATGADQASLGRVLAVGEPSSATLAKARTALGTLAASFGGAGSVVTLVDASGRVRITSAEDPVRGVAVPGGPDGLARVLASRSGVLVRPAPGDRVMFAAPVTGQNARVLGALVASVPLRTLLGKAPPAIGAARASDGAGATAWGSLEAAVSTQAAVSPLVLLALAALSLLAVPLAWLAGRSTPSRRRDPSAIAAAPSHTPTPGIASAPTAPTMPSAPAPTWALAQPAQRMPAYLQPPASAPSFSAPPAAGTSPAPAFSAPQSAPPATPVAPSPAAVPASPARRRRIGWGRGHAEPVAAAVTTPVEPVAAPLSVAATPEELQDTLTELGNQRGFGEEMDRLMVGWERNRVPFALLVIDVDDLKITNARAGHTAGDEALRTLGRHVKGMLRFSDRAFRVGGDEIAVLLPHTDAPGAAQLGQRLLAKVRAGTGGEPALAFSAGAAALPGPAKDRDQLMDQANAALAWGKSHGRASVLAYDPATHAGQTDADRVAQAAAVAQVIAERTLRAVFQPIVDMQTGDVVGYEGLTRPTPGAPFTNPGQLFEAAEHVGRTVELDAACFETIVEGARAIPSDRVVTINLSPRTMEAADFSVSNVLEVLRSHDLDPGRVVLELTERESVLDFDRLRDNLSELQRAGVRIAADDVGAGNAGLRLLSQFRFDIVKVDLGLVQEGANNEASRAVLRSLRDLAQRWGAFVIAEGIETPMQLKVVRELGLSAGQGYLIGRPGTIVDLPPVDLDGLAEGGMMLQNAPVLGAPALPHASPA